MKLSQQVDQNLNVTKQLVDCFVLNYICDDGCDSSVLETGDSSAKLNNHYVGLRRATVFSALTHLDKSVRLLLEVFGKDIAKRIEPLSAFFGSHAHYRLGLRECVYRLKCLLEANEADHSFLFSFLESKSDLYSCVSCLSSMSESMGYSVNEWEEKHSTLMSVGPSTDTAMDISGTSLSEKEKANLILSYVETTQKVSEEPLSTPKHWTQCEPSELLSMCNDLKQILDDFRVTNSEY